MKVWLKVYFCNFENRNGENNSFSCEENWEKVSIKGTWNRKVSSIKYDHKLEITVLKDYKKTFFPHLFDKSSFAFTLLDYVNLDKKIIILLFWIVYCVQQTFFLRFFITVILNIWSYFSVEALGWSEPTFMFTVPLIPNLFPILFTAERNVFTFYIFKIAKLHLWVIFSSLNPAVRFFNFLTRRCLTFLGIIFNT